MNKKVSGITLQLAFTLLLKVVNVAAWRIDPIVVSKVGEIRGRRSDEGDYFKFTGIPYATVNKSNPFGDATPCAPFKEIFEAYEDQVLCPQENYFSKDVSGTLDCLRLNIFVPYSALKSTKGTVVLVSMCGGRFAFSFGNKYTSSSKYLVEKDVILVNINHRLNIYGFLCLNIPEAPPNQGLRDQLIALKWIKNNIHSFGGDPHRITLMGDSSGAVTADLQVHFNSEKLFNQLILQGGSIYKDICYYRRDDTGLVLRLSETLGFPTNNTVDALAHLITLDSRRVASAAIKFCQIQPCLFAPCVENVDNVKAFIREDPIYQIPNVKGMSVLIGFCSDEGRIRHGKQNPKSYDSWNDFYNMLQTTFNFAVDELEYYEKVVRKFYIGDEGISYELRQKLIDFQSDIVYVYPIKRQVDKYINSGAEKVYQSMFSYNGSRNAITRLLGLPNSLGGATHGDYLGYLYYDRSLPEPSPEDQLIIDRMTTLWTNFAKYGDPTPETSDLLPVKWEPITKFSPRFYLNINTTMSLETNPFHERMVFWDTFYEMNGKLEKGYLHKNASETVISTDSEEFNGDMCCVSYNGQFINQKWECKYNQSMNQSLALKLNRYRDKKRT